MVGVIGKDWEFLCQPFSCRPLRNLPWHIILLIVRAPLANLPLHAAKIRFVDQRPEVENSYASDEAELSSSRSDHNQEAGLRTERHKSPLTADKSFISQREPPPHSHRLSTSTATNENVSGRPQAKRRRTTDSTTPTFPSTSEARPASVYDPIRFSYRVYDSGGAFHPADFHGLPDVTEQHHVPKVVEAEYRRLADSAAATIPPEVLLSPAIWKEQFYWPNKFTTTQCACLMRYYIEHLAPWVGHHLLTGDESRAAKNSSLTSAIRQDISPWSSRSERDGVHRSSMPSSPPLPGTWRPFPGTRRPTAWSDMRMSSSPD